MKREIGKIAMKLGIFDFFSGRVGTTKGFHPAEYQPVFGLDIDADAVKTIQFGPPEQNRVKLKSVVATQTFPDVFLFFGSLNSEAKQAGNAIPLEFDELFSKLIIKHFEENGGCIGKI